MTNKITKIPQIRFNDFTEDWEQRKLSDVTQITMGQSPNGENYTENPDDHILVQGNADMKNGRVVPRVWTTQVTKTAEPNDIIISVRAPVGDVGKTEYNVVLGRGVAGIRGNDFIYQSLIKMKDIGFWTRFSTGSTFESINSTDLKEAILLVPSEEEQQKIGAFFKSLDHAIALHQREYDLLKLIKQRYLKELFPKKERKYPEFRFEDFMEPWEQHKIGDVFSERLERSGEGELISVTINSGVVKASELDRKDNSSNDKSNYKKVEVGDIAYNSMRMWQGASGYSDYAGILSPAYTVIIPKEDVNSKFFAYNFKRYDMIQIFKRNSQGLTSDTWNLKFPTLKSIKVLIPSIEEQKQIAVFFDRINDNISLHHQNLENLKQMKKSLLQKLFV